MQKMPQAISKSAHRAFGVLIAKHKAFGGMPYAVFSKLYDNVVAPVIQYAAAERIFLYQYCAKQSIQICMGCGKFTPNTAVRVDM